MSHTELRGLRESAMSEREQPPAEEPIRPNEIADAGRPPAAPEPNVLTAAPRRTGLAPSTIRLLDASAAQLGRARLPGISGRWSALVLLGLFVVSAVAVPLALHRALWVEAEVVIAIWFVIWTGALTWLGYAGRSVAADWGPYRSLWSRMRGDGSGAPDSGRSSGGFDISWLGGGWDVPDFGTGGDGDGCASAIIGVILLAVVVVVLYFTVGWVVPFVAFALYALIRTMLNRVGDRAHETRGDLPASLGRGVLWAAVYTAPLAIAVWVIHAAA